MGGKSPQGLAQQRKRRGKKNFSGPGKRFLSQGAGKAVPVEPAGPAPPVPCRCRPQDRGQGKTRGKGQDPSPVFVSWASARQWQSRCGAAGQKGYPCGRRTDMGVKRSCPSRASRRTAKVRLPAACFGGRGSPLLAREGIPSPTAPILSPALFQMSAGACAKYPSLAMRSRYFLLL